MEIINKINKLESSHGIVASYPDQFFGYFGWPTITRMQDGTLLAAASGLRNYHVCPFGRTIICTSNDDGKTWTSPRVINDSPFDDRDAGILSVKGENLVLSWFTTDNRSSIPSKYEKGLSDWEAKIWEQGIASMTDEAVTDFVGSWIRTSTDAGLSWNDKVRVPVSAPHGPIKLSNDELLYLGTETGVYVSYDEGLKWNSLRLNLPIVPIYDLKLHSTGKDIRYRPFLVKEEKILFMAMEGNDPVESGMSYGTPHDLASLYGNKRDKAVGPAQVPTGYDEKDPGRPVEKPQNYGSDKGNLSRDPLGKTGLSPERPERPTDTNKISTFKIKVNH